MVNLLLNAVTVDTTSDVVNVEHLDNICVQITAASISSGNGVFTVDGSVDGVNWTTGIAILNATATAVGTYVTSITLSSNTTAAAYIRSGFKLLRVKVDVTTDGAYSAIIRGDVRR